MMDRQSAMNADEHGSTPVFGRLLSEENETNCGHRTTSLAIA
jgi:hypothetical protein